MDKILQKTKKRRDFVINTRLYSLVPIGLNTEMVESQISYLSRLAEAHQVTIGTLIEKVLAPLLGKSYLAKGKGSRFYDYAIELNAFGDQAADFAQALSILTGMSSINKLTLLSLKDAISSRNVFSKTKRWCPLCLEAWKMKDTSIYEPLIWNFKSINICVEHNILLNSICPNCDRALPHLTTASRNGFCPYCGSWLGSGHHVTAVSLEPELLSWEYYKAKRIGSLIRNSLNSKYTFDDIYSQLIAVIKFSGGVSAFSRRLNIPKSTVSTWIGGGHKPSLDALLRIYFAFGIELTDFFAQNQSKNIFLDKSIVTPPVRERKINRTAARKIDWITVEATLKNIIDNQKSCSPSVREAAMHIGCGERSLYCHFPELCKEIAAFRRQRTQSEKCERIKENEATIIEAAMTLYNNGFYPTRRRVEDLISPKLTLRRKSNYSAWKTALENLHLQ